ncbi:MAG: HNH endonuclease [Bacteroidota bacterium]
MKRKRTGEAKVFRQVWETRGHYCEVCGRGIHEPMHWNFAHVYPKRQYPQWRLEAWNIALLCLDCHQMAELGKLDLREIFAHR